MEERALNNLKFRVRKGIITNLLGADHLIYDPRTAQVSCLDREFGLVFKALGNWTTQGKLQSDIRTIAPQRLKDILQAMWENDFLESNPA